MFGLISSLLTLPLDVPDTIEEATRRRNSFVHGTGRGTVGATLQGVNSQKTKNSKESLEAENTLYKNIYEDNIDIFKKRDYINRIEFLRRNLSNLRHIAGLTIEDAKKLLLLKSKQAIYTLERDPFRMSPTQYYAWLGIFFTIALEKDNKILQSAIRVFTVEYPNENTDTSDLIKYEATINFIASQYKSKHPDENIIKILADSLPKQQN